MLNQSNRFPVTFAREHTCRWIYIYICHVSWMTFEFHWYWIYSFLTSLANKRLPLVAVPYFPWIENVFRKQTYAIFTILWLISEPVCKVRFTAVTPYKLALDSPKTYPDARFRSAYFYCYEFVFFDALGQGQVCIHFTASFVSFLPCLAMDVR